MTAVGGATREPSNNVYWLDGRQWALFPREGDWSAAVQAVQSAAVPLAALHDVAAVHGQILEQVEALGARVFQSSLAH